MKFLGRVFHLFCLSVGFFWTGVSAILVVLSSFVSESLMMDAHRLWAKGCLWIIGIHVRFEGLENLPRDHSVILAPNHASLFDILVLGAMPFNFKWLSKDEARKIPFVGWGMKRLGAFFVKRDRSGHDLNVLKGVEDGLRAGYSVVIFPEGTRTRTGQLLPLKKGAFKAAQNSGAPLLPVAIRAIRLAVAGATTTMSASWERRKCPISLSSVSEKMSV